MNKNPKKNLLGEAQAWAHKNNLHGKTVFSRYIMLLYLEGVQKVNSDFVFKGGNLLWHYIKTPRVTVGLDFTTLTIDSHIEVKRVLEKVHLIMRKFVLLSKALKKLTMMRVEERRLR